MSAWEHSWYSTSKGEQVTLSSLEREFQQTIRKVSQLQIKTTRVNNEKERKKQAAWPRSPIRSLFMWSFPCWKKSHWCDFLFHQSFRSLSYWQIFPLRAISLRQILHRNSFEKQLKNIFHENTFQRHLFFSLFVRIDSIREQRFFFHRNQNAEFVEKFEKFIDKERNSSVEDSSNDEIRKRRRRKSDFIDWNWKRKVKMEEICARREMLVIFDDAWSSFESK